MHRIRDLLFTPDGKYLVSSGADGQVILWDAESFERRFTLMILSPPDTPDPEAIWIAFTPNGEFNGSSGAETYFRAPTRS